MKLFAKTVGWACISSVIFFVSAVASDCHWQGALIASLLATASKTPFYPLWEMVFERILWKKSLCTQKQVTPSFLGEGI